MKSIQTWEGYPEIYVSNGSDYSPQTLHRIVKVLYRKTARYLSARSQPQFAPTDEGQNRRQTIDPLTGLTIPGIFY